MKMLLGDLVEVISGFAFKSEMFSSDSGVPLIRIRDVLRGYTETFYTGDFDPKYLVTKGDILVGMDGEFNSAEWTGINSLLNQRVCKIVPDETRLDRRYLLHFLPRQLKAIEDVTSFVTVKHLSVKDIRGIEVSLPSLEEQKRIAAILDKADSLRRKRAQAIALADDFLRATFLDMFGDPVTNPKGWPVKQLQELCDVATGATPSREVAAYYGGSIPWVKTGEVDSDWITTSEEFITETALNETNCKLFPPKTILMAMYGQGKTRGKTGMLGLNAATNQACAAILPSGKIQPEFLLCLLKLSYESIRALGRGGSQENLNLSIVKSLGVIVPDPVAVCEFLRMREKILIVVKSQIAAAGDGALLSRVLQGDKLN